MRIWFSATIFLSAGLLFLVQPMIAKMILPLLGGTTSVWNTCMVFFQAVLLAGYAYSHVLPERLGVRRHALLHFAVLLAPLLVLPFRVAGHAPPAGANPVPWLLGLLVVVVGLPFFALATGAPLLQRWFAETGHRQGRDPYFLYAASNLGSMLGLLGYPLLIEPRLKLGDQGRLWMGGYMLLVALTAVCAALLLRSRREPAPASGPGPEPGPEPAAREPDGPAPTLGRRLRWISLAFVPSSLMLGVTTYITTDMAAIPLLWVIPLALYLLSFIVVFSRVPLGFHRVMVFLLPAAIVTLVAVRMFETQLEIGTIVQLHLVAFLVVALVCHGELAHDRPPSRHLTEFYLWMALGGVLGGALNALVAPLVFNRIIEYPLVAVLVCFLNPAASLGKASRARAPAPNPASPPRAKRAAEKRRAQPAKPARRPGLRLSLGWASFGAVMGLLLFLQTLGGDPRLVVATWRSFYGVHRVKVDPFHHLIALLHGSTVHGIQSLDPAKREEPLSYFRRTGPIGEVFAALSGPRLKQRIAVLGLGAGTLASYAGSGQELTYYEIDPLVLKIASDTTYFTYLHDSRARGARVDVVLGDARLALAGSRDRYGLIVMDAFSSDVAPVHLITREALRHYLDHLEPDGVIAVHVSSRYFRLAPVLTSLAHDAGLRCLFQIDRSLSAEEKLMGMATSQWVVMARDPRDFGPLWDDARWQKLEADSGVRVWTDDYSNTMSAIIWSDEATEHWRRSPRGPRP